MAFVGLSWFGLFLVLSAAPGLTSSKNLPKSISIKLEKVVISPQENSKITKRLVSGLKSRISLKFGQGMRDFILHGKGYDVYAQIHPAFQATLTSSNIGPNYALGAIKFNDVSFNIGGAYNPSTGKFTAPIDGLYLFSVSYLQRNGYRSFVRLMKDNTVYSDFTFYI